MCIIFHCWECFNLIWFLLLLWFLPYPFILLFLISKMPIKEKKINCRLAHGRATTNTWKRYSGTAMCLFLQRSNWYKQLYSLWCSMEVKIGLWSSRVEIVLMLLKFDVGKDSLEYHSQPKQANKWIIKQITQGSLVIPNYWFIMCHQVFVDY